MEINHYGDNLIGVLPVEDIVEGRMVLLTSHTHNYDFGSKVDLPGVKMPDDTTEAGRARYCLMFAQDNRPLPIFQPMPYFKNALRYGWDKAANAPMTSMTIYLTHPGNQEGLTIPSGQPSAAFGPDSIMTAPSGAFIYSASIATPGTLLEAADAASDGAGEAGKLKVGSTRPVAEVIRWSSTDGLTFRLL